MFDPLDVGSKVATIVACVYAILSYTRDRKKGDDVMKQVVVRHVVHDAPNSAPVAGKPQTQAEAFEQYEDWKRGMFDPVPLFIDNYVRHRNYALANLGGGLALLVFMWLVSSGLPVFPFSLAPIPFVVGGAIHMRIARKRLTRRFPY